MDAIHFLLAPFAMCLILVGIHCYFGLHVLKRGIIFIDLSLAQVASLGSSVALLFHFEHESFGSYFISLFFTFIAAGYFAWAHKFKRHIPPETLIALVYAFSSALVILVVNYIAHGAEHIKEILVGKILWVTWSEVIKTACIYAIVALIHYKYRKQIIGSSFHKEKHSSYLWDFLFYALFGIVITSSVSIAGILLVFAFLVVPALISLNFSNSISKQLLIGWGIGIVLCLIGMLISYILDLPAGAVLVVVFTAIPLFLLPFLSKFFRFKPFS